MVRDNVRLLGRNFLGEVSERQTSVVLALSCVAFAALFLIRVGQELQLAVDCPMVSGFSE